MNKVSDMTGELWRATRNSEIEALYLDGWTLRRIGRRYNIVLERVRQILCERGVMLRSRGYRSPDPMRSRQSCP